jgi:transcriptional regulator with XRE-family HTH domain
MQAPDVGSRIKEAREAAGFSQTALARELGRGERTVQAWERNERTPRIDHLTQLAGLLGRSVAWFYEAPEDIAA